MSRAQSPSDSITNLLSRGLDHYGRNEIDEAVHCWRGVLELDPHHATARDYLETAGASEPPRGADVINLGAARAQLASSSWPPPSRANEPEARTDSAIAKLMRPQLERLLREHRYEEALALLYSARASNPKNSEIPKSIRLLRERLTADYAQQLGDLDRVPMLAPGALELNGEEQQVAGLVDGISSYLDIAAASPIGRLPTLRILSALEASGQLIPAIIREGPPTSRSGARSGLTGPRAPRPQSSDAFVAVRDSAPDSGTPPTLRRPTEPVRPSAPERMAQPLRATRPGTDTGDNEYTELFARATQAYLVRDMSLAMELFGECCRRRPEDPRPHHNLKTLSRRAGK
jgi:hypothetical protein